MISHDFPFFPLFFSLRCFSFLRSRCKRDEEDLVCGAGSRLLRRWLATFFSVQRPPSFSILLQRTLSFQVPAYDGSRQIADFGSREKTASREVRENFKPSLIVLEQVQPWATRRSPLLLTSTSSRRSRPEYYKTSFELLPG